MVDINYMGTIHRCLSYYGGKFIVGVREKIEADKQRLW